MLAPPMKSTAFFRLAACVYLWFGSSTVHAQQASVTAVPFAGAGTGNAAPRAGSAAPYNDLILQQIHTMPQAGGYSANHQATERLRGALLFTSLAGLNIEAARAQPSYCSGATYLVFMKTVGALARNGALSLDDRTYSALLINGQRDGEGIWGRWTRICPVC